MELKRMTFDQELSNDGIWVDIGHGASIKLARPGNLKFKVAHKAKFATHLQSIQSGDMDLELQTKLTRELYAETIITDWKGITFGGKVYKCNKTNAIKLLADFEEIFEAVLVAAGDTEKYRTKWVEDAEKN